MSNLLDHARRELEAVQRTADADENGRDDLQAEANESILRMVAEFAEVGHSGGSAGWAIRAVGRLLSFEPLTPLTGDDEEWMTVRDDPSANGGLQQNVRCGRVFRENGIAYDIDAVVYRERQGGGFTGWDSKRRVEFPYSPRTRYVRAWLRRPERLIARLRGQLVP